jgi:hypothetical protein
MMTGGYVAISAALLGTVSMACVVMFCQFENMIKKRLSAIRASARYGGRKGQPSSTGCEHTSSRDSRPLSVK